LYQARRPVIWSGVMIAGEPGGKIREVMPPPLPFVTKRLTPGE